MIVERQSKTLATVLAGRRRAVTGLVVSSLICGTSEAAFLVIVTRAAFSITDNSRSVDIVAGSEASVATAVLVALGLVCVRVIFSLLAAWQSARISAMVVADVRTQLAYAFLRSTWPTQQAHAAGRLQEMLTTYASNAAILMNSVASGITSAFNLVALLALALVVDPLNSSLAILTLGALGAILRPVRRSIGARARTAATAGMEFATSVSEISDLGMELHVFNVQPQIAQLVGGRIEDNRVITQKLGFLRQVVPTMYTGLAYFALVGAVAIVSASSAENLTSLGAVMLLMLRSLSYGQGVQSATATVSALEPFVTQLQAELAWYKASAESDDGQSVGEVGVLQLSKVGFAYVEGQPILADVDLSIRPREIIGVIGPSGSGKSTLVQLLLGLRHPTAGVVMANGRDISHFSKSEWARRVTFVPQGPHLISGSVADNIAFFRTGVSQTDIEQAARLAHLHEEVESWPEGYARAVGTRGGFLSGGQQQRLCIARALVERPDVIILDEPTAALDLKSESLVRETMAELATRMTVVVIAHRMSTLQICDRIMVIEGGRVSAFDSPSNLAETNGFYREAIQLSQLPEG